MELEGLDVVFLLVWSFAFLSLSWIRRLESVVTNAESCCQPAIRPRIIHEHGMLCGVVVLSERRIHRFDEQRRNKGSRSSSRARPDRIDVLVKACRTCIWRAFHQSTVTDLEAVRSDVTF